MGIQVKLIGLSEVSLWVMWWYVCLSEPMKPPGGDMGEVRLVRLQL